ncbi:MAG: 50S ribosomal protein L6 [Candidatus Neomarinimicrobiota bacterium]|nr:MAG: 50S ribosomal protein L6 [Candidatus Neomarinimicrobiota bacterium]
MSRIGKNPITIPPEIQVTLSPAAVRVQGPKGTLDVSIHPEIKVEQKDNQLVVTRPSDSAKHRALHGTMRQLVANAVQGVTQGFQKELELRGVGYQASMNGKRLVLQLGYSHDIIFEPPEGIDIKAERTTITIFGMDKQLVGEVAAKIRSFRKPEPYKGKGIRYKDEYVRIKQGKTVGS